MSQRVEHVPFIPSNGVSPNQTTLEHVQHTLPEGWEVKETVEGLLMFGPSQTKEQRWSHPDPNFIQPLRTLDDIAQPPKDFTPSYEALSYTWGNEETTVEVKICEYRAAETEVALKVQDQQFLLLRPNLHLALRYLRHEPRERVLWVDALCINQKDTNERALEVRKMCDIYRLSYRVVVWLGAPQSKSRRAMEILAHIGHQIEYTKDNFFVPAPGSTEKDWHRRDAKLGLTIEDGSAIQHFLERPWFTRLWIWQGIRLANHRAIVQCGEDSVLWYYIRRATLVLSTKHDIPATLSRDVAKRAGEIGIHHYQYSDSDYVFWQTRSAQYSLRQDRVYGILGLLGRSISNLVIIDYSLSTAEIYQSLCTAVLANFSRLDFFDWCDINDKSLPNRPSWVPNWSKVQV
jgi:hypothetical protein